ncbi:MAG TPA: hypothetical protein VIA06_21640 [Candidatus Dormibacteraeota bacterium]|nr:hypothetical protein [Candidatus Dormibacteraeota bacterium]
MSPVERLAQLREWAQDATTAVNVPFEGVKLVAAKEADAIGAESWLNSPGEGTCMVSIPAGELLNASPAAPVARLLGSITGAIHDAARGRLSDVGPRSRAARSARTEVAALAFARLGGVGDPPFGQAREAADDRDVGNQPRRRGPGLEFQVDTGDIGQARRTRSSPPELGHGDRGRGHNEAGRDGPGARG